MPIPKADDTAARKAALDVLNRLDQTSELLDTVLATRAAELCLDFSASDRKLVNAIVYGVLRWRRRLDWIIKQYAAMPASRISPRIMNILRMAVFQIIYLDRVPDFAVVNTSVEMAKQLVSVKSSRFVNGILRNILRHPLTAFETSLPTDPIQSLAISRSFPDWLIKRWVSRFGHGETASLCEAINQIPPVTVRTNTLKTDRCTLKKALSTACGSLYPTRYSSDGLSFQGARQPIDQLAAFQNGWFQVQDEAAQLVSRLLDPQPGEVVLDACAGMGGKTGHIGQLMNNTGRILAVDKDKRKLAMLETEMKRLGIKICQTRREDLDAPEGNHLSDRFDRILLDAPCSGTGVIRRNPDIKWAAGKQNLGRFARRQLAYLDKLAPRLAPAGVLVYSVCSIEPEETLEVVERFLKTHPEFSRAADFNGISFDECRIFDKQGNFMSLPHIHQMDGFFAARLKRKQ